MFRKLVIAVALLPLARLTLAGATGGLGANPIQTVTHVTGDWALRLLVASLAVAPLSRILGRNPGASYRRALGLLAFFYASLHVLAYAGLDVFFDWRAIVEDARERPSMTAGFVSFFCLLPLALTSTRAAAQYLGPRWQQLHQLVYAAAVAAVAHYLWLVKADVRAPLAYAGVLALLMAARLVLGLAGHRRRPGTGGQSKLRAFVSSDERPISASSQGSNRRRSIP